MEVRLPLHFDPVALEKEMFSQPIIPVRLLSFQVEVDLFPFPLTLSSWLEANRSNGFNTGSKVDKTGLEM